MRRDYQKIILYFGVLLLILFLLKYVLPFFLPFIIALIFVIPLHRFYQKHGWTSTRWKGFLSGSILFTFAVIAFALLFCLAAFLLRKLQSIMQNIHSYLYIYDMLLDKLCYHAETYLSMDAFMIREWVEGHVTDFFSCFTSQNPALLSKSLSYFANMGQFAAFMVVSYICVVLFSKEVELWKQGLLNLALIEPAIDRVLSILLRIGKKLGAMLKIYAKTQGKIMALIIGISIIGLLISGIDSAVFWGVVTGILDMLPFIGTSIILLPLGILQCINGRLWQGVVIFATYLLCVIVREVLEPKFMGQSMRISPVAILLFVYAGIMYYGIGGVILGPVTLLLAIEIAKEIFMNTAKDA